MIQVRDLRVDYDDVCAVHELSLAIPPGEIYGLIGPNGAGKTTTMRALTGLLEPTYGEIVLNGIDLSLHREEAIGCVGFMPDAAPLYEDLTVWEYLDLFAASYFIPRERRREVIDTYLEMVDLTEKRHTMTAGLSRGMKQRLILAKTLIPEPNIIILDEPASGLDPHGRVLLKNILRHLASTGKAIIISSHILIELSEFCTAIGVMERGRMVVSGKVDEITTRVLGQAEIVIELLSPPGPCLDLLQADQHVSAIRQDEATITCAFTGTPDDAGDLLARLVQAGVKLSAFGRKRENLEEVFMKVGAKEVS